MKREEVNVVAKRSSQKNNVVPEMGPSEVEVEVVCFYPASPFQEQSDKERKKRS